LAVAARLSALAPSSATPAEIPAKWVRSSISISSSCVFQRSALGR
jgi:hypothetical protein